MLLLGIGIYFGYQRYRGVDLWPRAVGLLLVVVLWQAAVIGAQISWRSQAGLSSAPFGELMMENFVIDVLLLAAAYWLGRGLARWRKGKAVA